MSLRSRSRPAPRFLRRLPESRGWEAAPADSGRARACARVPRAPRDRRGSDDSVWASGRQPARLWLRAVRLAAILRPPRGGDTTFPPTRGTWGRCSPDLEGPHASVRVCKVGRPQKEGTSALSSGMEVEEPARTFGSSAPPSPARSFSRTVLAPKAEICPVARVGSTSPDTAQDPAPRGTRRVWGGGGSLCHTCARVDDRLPGALRSARGHPTQLAPSRLCLVTGTPAPRAAPVNRLPRAKAGALFNAAPQLPPDL